MFSRYLSHDWIWTQVLWFQKWPLNQLCPSTSITEALLGVQGLLLNRFDYFKNRFWNEEM